MGGIRFGETFWLFYDNWVVVNQLIYLSVISFLHTSFDNVIHVDYVDDVISSCRTARLSRSRTRVWRLSTAFSTRNSSSSNHRPTSGRWAIMSASSSTTEVRAPDARAKSSAPSWVLFFKFFENFLFFEKNCLDDKSLFVRPLIPLFWTSGDFSSGGGLRVTWVLRLVVYSSAAFSAREPVLSGHFLCPEMLWCFRFVYMWRQHGRKRLNWLPWQQVDVSTLWW